MMDFVEYIKEVFKKVENEHGVCRVKMGEDEFFYHDKCFCDFHKDFAILYDKGSDVSLVTRYEAIDTLQYCPEDKLNELRTDIKKDLFDKLIEGLGD